MQHKLELLEQLLRPEPLVAMALGEPVVEKPDAQLYALLEVVELDKKFAVYS